MEIRSKDLKAFLTNEKGDILMFEGVTSVWFDGLRYAWHQDKLWMDTALIVNTINRKEMRVGLGIETMLTIGDGDYGTTTKVICTGYERGFVSGYVHTAFKFRAYPFLRGLHVPGLYVVRFDVGDGTYRETYAHKNEIGTVVERFYNRQNLWR